MIGPESIRAGGQGGVTAPEVPQEGRWESGGLERASGPHRIQLRRTKGWRKPEGAVVVARPSKWGNPFTVAGAMDAGYAETEREARTLTVEAFREWVAGSNSWWSGGAHLRRVFRDDMAELAGRDLACWCPLDQPCHADVLLEMANEPAAYAAMDAEDAA